MEIAQKTYLNIEKGSKVVQIVVDQDMPLGLLFDALMEAKAYCVERMTAAQQAEEAEAEDKMGEKVEEVVQEEEASEEA